MPNPLTTAMDGGMFTFRLTLADPGEAPLDAARVSEALAPILAGWGVGPGEGNALHIAVEELVTNLGKFGPAGIRPGEAVVAEGTVGVDGDEVVLTVSDNGPAFDPASVPAPPLGGEAMDRNVGGLGLFMLFHLFHEFRYRRENGHNVGSWILRRGKGSEGENP